MAGNGDDIAVYLDPNDASGVNGASGNPDSDGYSNLQEYVRNTDPTDGSRYDNDGDGMDEIGRAHV